MEYFTIKDISQQVVSVVSMAILRVNMVSLN